MKITEFFIDNFKLTNMVLLFILFGGGVTMLNLPRQGNPNVNMDILSITTIYPGASPEDVEINVTDPLEDELEQIDGILRMHSNSIESMSLITLELDPDYPDSIQLRNDIRSALDSVTNLPKEVKSRPVLKEIKSTDFPVMELAIVGPKDKYSELRDISKSIESEIKNIGGVGQIIKLNFQKKEVHISCDAKKLEAQNISFTDVIHAIKRRNVKLSGGTLESFVDEKKIVTFSEFENPLDVSEVIIRSNFDGKQLKVKDIAEVTMGYEKPMFLTRSNGEHCIHLTIKRSGSTDVIDLTKEIVKIVKKYQDRYSKSELKIRVIVDYTIYTKSLLRIVTMNALAGFILVVLSLFIFLNFRTAFWVGLGIPVSVFGAYLFMPAFDLTTNMISLITMVVVLGMIVDDAIVVAENINRHIETGMEPRLAAIQGTKEVFKPVCATIITTILCFSPLLFMTGILGKFIYAIPVIVILTLLMSLFESVTLLPSHLANQKKGKAKTRKLTIYLRKKYTSVLRVCLRNRGLVLLTFFIIFVATAMFSYSNYKYNLFPAGDVDLFYIVMETDPGDSLEVTSTKVKEIEKIVDQISDDLMIGYKTIIGDHRTEEMANDPSPHKNWALITIILHPAAKRDLVSDDIIKNLSKKVGSIKTFKKLIVRSIKDGPPVGKAINLKLVSDNINLTAELENEILAYLKNHPDLKEVTTSNKIGKKEIRLRLNYEQMAKLKISAIDVSSAVRIAYDGNIATTVRNNGEEIDFRVQLQKDQRGNKAILGELQVPNQLNKLIKLKDISKAESSHANESITHFKGKKAIVITAELKEIKNSSHSPKTSQEINDDVKKLFENKIDEIPEIEIIFGGEGEQTAESFKYFKVAFLFSMMAIYCTLILLLDSFIQPFLIMVAIPFGLVGVIIAFYIHGIPLSFIALIGTLGMIGVVVNDSLVMVTYLNDVTKKHKSLDIEVILEGASTRLRPVLLTTITTVLGLLPTIYGFIWGTEPFIIPMVLAMASGLIFATVITLILIPVLYSLLPTIKTNKKVQS
ncbi:MAG: hypothetical protein COA79_06350 [Planctomycetota bacterium]|nr:MAG: hypothetical protein COA79_06350 [Planctomycetota bacterium]